MAEYMAIFWVIAVVLIFIAFTVPWDRFWKK
jgi:hypothetical protein